MNILIIITLIILSLGFFIYSILNNKKTKILMFGNDKLKLPDLNNSNIKSISAGSYHSLALTSNGTVFAWGNNDSAQTNIPPGLNNVIAISAGSNHSLALKNDGTVIAWGDNSYGHKLFLLDYLKLKQYQLVIIIH